MQNGIVEGEPPLNGESPATTSHLYSTLHALGIPIREFPYGTDDDDRQNVPGLFCKNLFLKDRKGTFYLVITTEEKNVDLKSLKSTVQAHRNFSFATNKDLFQFLGVLPGGVTPFGLLNKPSCNIRIIIDEDLVNSNADLNFHPLDPVKTFPISFDNLSNFIRSCSLCELEVVKMKP